MRCAAQSRGAVLLAVRRHVDGALAERGRLVRKDLRGALEMRERRTPIAHRGARLREAHEELVLLLQQGQPIDSADSALGSDYTRKMTIRPLNDKGGTDRSRP